jgi:diguanylate cyclase (GGDEF)-like protein
MGPHRAELEQIKALRERERAESERALLRLRRELDDVSARAKEQSEVFQLVPDLLRQMFAAKGRRQIWPLALKLLDQLFRPEQSAIFVARPAQRRLSLGEGRGLSGDLQPGHEIEYGHDRIGHVAENRLTMDESDFRAVTAVVRRHLEATAVKGLKADVVAPVEDESGLIAVLCLGGVRIRQGQEKKLLRMVADLTAVAATHLGRLRNVEEAADRDGLTGAYNKRYFQRRLGDEIQKAEREHRPLSLLILDIDHFKHYNDTNGHLAGDEVLKKVGQILKSSIREDDTAARYGGEEFVILYPGAQKELAARLAEQLRRAVEGHPFPHRGTQPLGAVTISGGVATFPEDSRNGVDLIRCADQALYEAKGAGRNRIVAASPNYLT